MSQVKDVLNSKLDSLSQNLTYCEKKLNYLDNRIRETGRFDAGGIYINDELNAVKVRLDRAYSSELKIIEETVDNLEGQGIFNAHEIQQLNGKRFAILKDLDALQSKLYNIKNRLKQKNLFAYLIDSIDSASETVSNLIFTVTDLAFDALVNKTISGFNPGRFLPFS